MSIESIGGPVTPQISNLGANSASAAGGTGVVGEVPAGSSFRDVLQTISANNNGTPAEATPTNTITESPATRPIDLSFTDLVRGIGESESRIDRLIDRGMRGRSVSQSELLSMQALVYQYSQQMGIASKLTEGITSGVKQILNIQI
jgi:hypothetical protein